MTSTFANSTIGFVLESADSVRFGPEYTTDEVNRNRQMLFGELLCGLLMGEPIWTNAVFAFDSQGMVEVLGAISRAFLRVSDQEQFLPFIISVYPQDSDPWAGKQRSWQNPGELFLRCYSHRLQNVGGFQLSATPHLQEDKARRGSLAEQLREAAETGRHPVLSNLVKEEQKHFDDLFSIDQYLRSWLRGRQEMPFEDYAASTTTHDMPIRLIRGHWQKRYRQTQDGKPLTISKLRDFLEQADACILEEEADSPLFPPAKETLSELLKLPPDHECFKNRSLFRKELKQRGIGDQSPTFRLLIELVDGHYIRTQYTELSHTAREVTSPASKSAASQIGEVWAARTMHTCLESSASSRPWQFINRIKAAPSKERIALDMDGIAHAFADFASHPDRRAELGMYHQLLALARKEQTTDGGRGDAAKGPFAALQSHVTTCIDRINDHMASTGVEFHFNVNDEATCAGSLTLTFQDCRSTSQCTGPKEIDIDPAEPDSQIDRTEGFDNNLPPLV